MGPYTGILNRAIRHRHAARAQCAGLLSALCAAALTVGAPTAARGGDTLTYNGSGGALVVDLAAASITESGFGPINYVDITLINLNCSSAALTFEASATGDLLTVQPLDATAAELAWDGLDSPFFVMTSVGTLTLNPDTSSGNSGADEIRVLGTTTSDTVVVSGTQVSVTGKLPVTMVNNEALTVSGLQGDDTFTVTPSPTVNIHIDGGLPVAGSDVLNVLAGGAAYAVAPGPAGSGTVLVTGFAPLTFSNIETLLVDGAPAILPDAFEPNETLGSATLFGPVEAVTLQGLTIHSTTDEDWFMFTPPVSGALMIDARFTDAAGDIDIQLLDAAGTNIASSASASDDESIVVPVVAQERYVLRVLGYQGAMNDYDLLLQAIEAPTPSIVLLASESDTGVSESDGITQDTTPTVGVLVDLADFGTMGIPVDQGAGTPGAEVVVLFASPTSGAVTEVAADRVAGLLWTATPATPLAEGDYVVSARVRIEDGRGTPATGDGPASTPINIRIDTSLATPTVDLIVSSDTGMLSDDGVTRMTEPAFNGIGEVGSFVFLHAQEVVGGNPVGNPVLVGETRVGSDVTDVLAGIPDADSNDGIGLWEITCEPMDDGTYDYFVLGEDGAGNVALSSLLRTWIDTTGPNTPFLDLLNDDGLSATDNVTGSARLDFEMIGNDTLDGGDNPFPNDIKYRLYWRPGAGSGEVLVYDSWSEFGAFTTIGGLFRTVSQSLNDPLGVPFPFGPHNFKLEVEDRAGNISDDFLLDVVMVAPPDPPMATAVAVDGGTRTVSWNADTNFEWIVQVSRGLLDDDWADAGIPSPTSNGVDYVVVDTNRVGFFRLVYPGP